MLLCQKSADCVYVSLVLGSLRCFTDIFILSISFLGGANVNDIVFLISNSTYSLLMYRKVINFGVNFVSCNFAIIVN